MKYGLLVNEKNENIGDDIQSYAESQFLPRVDVMVDRENLDIFKYGDGSNPVALIMGAWYMWKKHNWPPSRQIVPCLIAYHHFERRQDPLEYTYALPIYKENYEGIGGQWFKDFGPVGCRDLHTKRVFDSVGIPNYFSGCVTLTLPKQPETKDKGKYIVLVDLPKKIEKKIRKLANPNLEIRVMTHKTPNIAGCTWEERKKRTIEYLTIYQNAAYVVTRRLHVSLPCLAMGVPVLLIQPEKVNDPERFEPYNQWLHSCTEEEFMKKGYDDFDFMNGTPNADTYLKTRKELIKTMKDFVSYCEKNKNKPLSFFDKRTYTLEEENAWRVSFMREILNRTHIESKRMQNVLKSEKNDSIPKLMAKTIYRRKIKNSKLGHTKPINKLKKIIKKTI